MKKAHLILLVAFILFLALPSPATTFTAQLQTVTGTTPPNFIRLTLKNCGGYIPHVSGVGVIGGKVTPAGLPYFDVYPNSLGLVSFTAQDESTITCGVSTGVAYYNVAVMTGAYQVIASNDYDISGASFDLSTATPKAVAPVSPAVLAIGPAGAPIKWLGTFSSPPSSPAPDNAYRDTSFTPPQSRVWDGSAWQLMVQDGPTGATGPAVPLASTAPPMDGTAAAGTSTSAAHADHVHPSDTSRVPTSQTVNGHPLSSPVVVSASDLNTGTLPASAEPAHSGDVTNTAGYLTTTVTGIKGYLLPTLATGYLQWTGSAFAWATPAIPTVATTTPLMDGTAAIGSTGKWADAGHVHPSDSSRLAIAGGIMTGKLTTVASSTSSAGVNFPHGSAPTTPTNGDCWTTIAGFYCQINGSTVGPFGTSSSSVVWPAAAGIPYWSSGAAWAGSYSNTNQIPANYVNLSTFAPLASPTFTGTVTVPDGAPTAPYLAFSGSSGSGFSHTTTGSSFGGPGISSYGQELLRLQRGKFIVTRSDAVFGWSSGTGLSTAPDTGLSRTSAGTVVVGNGTAGDYSGTINATNYQVAATPVTINRASMKFAWIGTIPNSQIFAQILPDSSEVYSVPANCTNSRAESTIAATASTTLTLYKCTAAGFATCSSVGTIVFAAAGKTGTWTCSSAFSLTGSSSQSFYIQAPSTADTTLANLSIALYATHN